MKNHLTLLAFWIYSPLCAIAQDIPYNFPPNAQPGKCYYNCYIPDQYKPLTLQILLAEGYTKYEMVAATYDTVVVDIVERPAYTTHTLVPPVFEIVTEQIAISDTVEQLQYIPPTFETISESILIQPASTQWQKTRRHACIANTVLDTDVCQVWCLVEVASQYQIRTQQVLKTPARIETRRIPPRYITLRKALLKSAAQVILTDIVPITRQIKTLKLKSPATQKAIEIPPQYSTITTNQLSKKAHIQGWLEVMCEHICFPQKIRQIQQALNKRGYRLIEDNLLNPETRKALIDLQEKNGLPVGSLNMETVRFLGVE